MEVVNMKQLFNQIRGNKTLLYALEQELKDRDLLDEVYNDLHYEIKDGEINYEIDLYRDIKNGKLYNYNDLLTNPLLSVTKYKIYCLNENVSLKFKDYLVATEHRVKKIPASDYHKDDHAKIVSFEKQFQVGGLSHLMTIYPELFIFLTAYYNIHFDSLENISKQDHVYKKEIK